MEEAREPEPKRGRPTITSVDELAAALASAVRDATRADPTRLFVPRDVLKYIFRSADATTAMSFAQTSTASQDVRLLLRENDIWEHWFKRDLSIVYNAVDMKKMVGNREVLAPHPVWKVMYLWIRFFVGYL